MPRVHWIQNTLNAGEWSPLMAGRSDLKRYRDSLKTCLNMIVLPQGGAQRRPGTLYANEVKTSATATRLIGFMHAAGDYVLEFGAGYIRYYRDGAQITRGGSPVETVTSYAAADVFAIQIAASATTLYLAHPSYPPAKLTRTSHTAWTFTTLKDYDGPFEATNTDATHTLTPDATTGAITITATGFTPFAAGHIDSVWRIVHGATLGLVRITSFTSSTEVGATVLSDLGATTATSTWREGTWSGVKGYPAAVAIHQQRLWWAGTTDYPDSLWASKVADYEYYDDVTTEADDPMKYTLGSSVGRGNDIRWLMPHRRFLVGTSGHEWQVGAGDIAEPITPTSRNARADTCHGSATVQPILAQNVALMLQRDSRKIRELRYSEELSSYVLPDLTALAEHVTEGGIVQMAYQQEPYSVVWAVRSDGVLCGMTYDTSQQVVAWHRHTTEGSFESVAVIPHPDGDRDQVWVIVNRTIDGSTVRYVEYFDDGSGYYADQSGLQTDSTVAYSGSATATVTGLDHLEGETVDILGSGIVYPQQAVSSGAVTGLDPTVTQAEVGLPFTSTIENQPPEIGGGGGSTMGLRQRVANIKVLLHESLGGTIAGDRQDFRKASDPTDEAVALFTGYHSVSNLGWDEYGVITISQTQPLPMTVLSLMATITAGDK